MIPRLFESTATTFTNFGICPLPDCIECIVTEERNGAYVLDMEYPKGGQFADQLAIDRIILADPHDNASQAEPFRIISVEYDLSDNIVVQAEHISYQLNYIIIGKNTNYTRYPSKFWEKETENMISASNPFTFATDISDDAGTVYQYGCDQPTPLRKLLGGMDGSMIDLFGGEFEWNRYTVNLWASRGADHGVKIAYGKNLTGLNYSIDLSNVYTGVVAFWSDGETTVESALQTMIHSYAFSRDIVVDASGAFDSQPSVADLNAWASAYLANNAADPRVSVEVEFVPLWQTEEYKDFYDLEHVSLCDTVTVLYPPLNLSIAAKVVKTVYNVLANRYDEITISTIRPTLSDTIFALMKEIS